jgi:hypothetical protein
MQQQYRFPLPSLEHLHSQSGLGNRHKSGVHAVAVSSQEQVLGSQKSLVGAWVAGRKMLV